MTQNGTCAICAKDIPKGSLAYFDPTKRQKSHLAHPLCWETLREERRKEKIRGQEVKKAPKPEILSTERLAPPF